MHRTPAHCRSAPRGMHLVEMLVVIAILSVLLAVGWPALRPVLLRQRADALQLTLHASLSSARSEALKRRELIGLCASDDGEQCSRDWSAGWIIYRSGRHRGTPASAQDILIHHQGRTDIAIVAQASGGRPLLFFQPDGRSPGANLTLRICAGDRLHGRLVINNGGRIRSERVDRTLPC
ncbi:TPA: GspH/FimT family pseudopilin [Stenotrophomonas maltophilia]|uniref:GspH/FimT family pseudopilin n=1 Tax=Stenotrophomonas maltophilia TaxID=40324 RepID=UPI0007396AE1|nr:GspH/FimT family pseudopilin [Stenotrophomonas maltophilia]SSM88697.1 type 4 fimbrial biogenesis protein FimT [Acinetobacter baumannii]MBH1498100.1 GspH/FimT family pseudopilin [Stenotrophomonas maltophilia]MBH1533351.1 GspH/FimT family pseudopilin [Stenotrophomonas maltophilia]MBH1877824.1 GspH/FimT family pseudopilin [Stenotrophomonas maltophilia]MBN4944912.1 GspH/FimT family pseudopilin [Stenotrophomonas maltophilia]